LKGKIIKTLGGGKYLLVSDQKKFTAAIRGKLKKDERKSKTVAAVGDIVGFSVQKDGTASIEEILPRKNSISKKVSGKRTFKHTLVANIDQIIVFTSVKEPPLKTGLIDRFLVIAEREEIPAVICINKIDLGGKIKATKTKKMYESIGYDVLITSVFDKTGISEFKEVLKDKDTVLMGHSGVGKSSIINLIEENINLKIGDISRKWKKGKHTTTMMEMFELSFGGHVIDTPGLKEIGFWDFEKEEIKYYYKEFNKYNDYCRFRDCLHITEPGCSVKEALENDQIYRERYDNYLRIVNSLVDKKLGE